MEHAQERGRTHTLPPLNLGVSSHWETGSAESLIPAGGIHQNQSHRIITLADSIYDASWRLDGIT